MIELHAHSTASDGTLDPAQLVARAVAVGVTTPRILLRHLLPNALPPLIVSAAFGVGWAILAEASLSFLGVGLPAPAVSGRDPLVLRQLDRGGVVDRAVPGAGALPDGVRL